MIFVLNPNIIFSAILKPKSIIAAIVLELESSLILMAPEFLKHEIKKQIKKWEHILVLAQNALNELISLVFLRPHFYPDKAVPDYIQYHADQLVADVYPKDSLYVRFALFFNSRIWTGDLKQYEALHSKGFDLIVGTQALITFLSSNKNS